MHAILKTKNVNWTLLCPPQESHYKESVDRVSLLKLRYLFVAIVGIYPLIANIYNNLLTLYEEELL